MANKIYIDIKSEIDEEQTFLLEEKHGYTSETSKELQDECCGIKGTVKINISNIIDDKTSFITSFIKKELETEDAANVDQNLEKNNFPIKPENKENECDVYEPDFTLKVELQNHSESDSEKNSSVCNVCGKNSLCECKTDRKEDLTEDIAESAFSCETCGKSFSLKNNLKRHQLIHIERKPFSCGICGKSVSRKKYLNNHLLQHTGRKPYSCATCGKSFFEMKSLKNHQINHTGEKCFSCDICGKSFFRNSDLKKHRLIHTGIKHFSCDICGKSFSQRSDLKRHLFVHTGEKPHSCETCGKGFSEKSHLKRHQVVHTGEKCFSCEICGESFPRKRYLKQHELMHNGNNSFSDMCDLKNLQLKRMDEMEMDEKLYSCDSCNKSFSRKTALKAHRLKHSKGKPYSCDSCDKIFSRKTVPKTYQLERTDKEAL